MRYDFRSDDSVQHRGFSSRGVAPEKQGAPNAVLTALRIVSVSMNRTLSDALNNPLLNSFGCSDATTARDVTF
jgi:hypothetical protein